MSHIAAIDHFDPEAYDESIPQYHPDLEESYPEEQSHIKPCCGHGDVALSTKWENIKDIDDPDVIIRFLVDHFRIATTTDSDGLGVFIMPWKDESELKSGLKPTFIIDRATFSIHDLDYKWQYDLNRITLKTICGVFDLKHR
jgi:hypothetical protein